MSTFFEKSRVLIDTANGLLCRIYYLKGHLISDEKPEVLRSGKYARLRSKLEKNFPLESSDYAKVCTSF